MSNIQITETNTRQPAKGFAITPSSVVRDPHLSLGARTLYTLIDSHQGVKGRQRLKIATLAGELGVSDRATSRYINELKAAGHLTTKATGRSLSFTVTNPSRRSKLTADSPAQVIPRPAKSGERDLPPVARLQSINPLSNKSINRLSQKNTVQSINAKACTHEIPTVTVEITETQNAAAKSGTDSLTLEQFRDLLPEQIRPRPETHLANTLAAALERGWTVQGLALAIKAEIPNPQAGPGLTVKILRQLSQRPPSEYSPPPAPKPRYDSATECEHGVLKVYGGCGYCREAREAEYETARQLVPQYDGDYDGPPF